MAKSHACQQNAEARPAHQHAGQHDTAKSHLLKILGLAGLAASIRQRKV
ncbi:MAG: hypothetical protein PHQ58_12890 [Rhodoferax sp.]|nr:hypothetical protein [Rhodoferax sp.]MDD2881325.1 hypothetical protein [Rhodoferax sp.]